MRTHARAVLMVKCEVLPVVVAVMVAAVLGVEPVEQVHLALGSDPSEMTVQWATNADNTVTPYVQYGLGVGKMSMKAPGHSVMLHDHGTEKRNITTHTVFLTDLRPGTRYYYRAGSHQGGWSNVFTFKTLPEDTQTPLAFAVYGDLGLDNGLSMPALQDEVLAGNIDVVCHVGDFAYDLHDDQGKVGDRYMNALEPIAAYVPYMVCPGNHESDQDFNHYTKRFSGMPFRSSGGSRGNWFYSFDAGLVHVMSFSSEIYFYKPELVEEQYHWMENDLRKANMNRKEVPWLVVMGHRPIYCSTNSDCDDDASKLRDGRYGVEELFMRHGVDLYLVGHVHNYERLYPTYKFKVEKHDRNYYKSPTSVVQVITGSAGCEEEHSRFVRPMEPFSAYRTMNYGYSRMVVHNATHLYWEQVDVEEGIRSVPEDYLWIEQSNHGPHTGSRAMFDSADIAMFYSKGMAAAVEAPPGGCPTNAVRGCAVDVDRPCECIQAEVSPGGALMCSWAPCTIRSHFRGAPMHHNTPTVI